jgi:hypothetical protein
MNSEELALFDLQRVTAYEGLPIDVPTWTAAHAYHETLQRLHNRALHGWGLVTGLEVLPTDPPSHAVVITPGVAVDRDGRIIHVPRRLRLQVSQVQPGPVCLVLRFAELPAPPTDGLPSARVSDSYQLLEVIAPLAPGDLELARVEVGSARTLFHDARDPTNPRLGEIDRRFRRELRARLVETVTVGRLSLTNAVASEAHHRGLINMVRDLQATAPFAVQLAEDVRADQVVGHCDLLYVSGAGELRLTPREGALLLAFVRSGGVVFAEPCSEEEAARQESGRFAAGFRRLVADLKHALVELDAGHPLFSARHVFGLPPEGIGGHAPLLGNGTIILNPNDYGCCWEGGPRDHRLAREPIRGAMEFAANLVWWTAEQVRAARAAGGVPLGGDDGSG